MKVRFLLMVIAMGCAFLTWTGVAFAASPQDIYDDYMADGHLDGTYTDAELQAFLGDANLHQYGDPTIVSSLDAAVASMLTSESGGRPTFPFTGAQLALMGFAALGLVAGGVGLRRLSRSRAS